MIKSFGDKITKQLFQGLAVRRMGSGAAKTGPETSQIHRCGRHPRRPADTPANRLEALQGDLKGWYSIRVNDQFRIIFRWFDDEAHDVKLIDYH
ncbi:plasmid maintenance system killer protein [Asticcacaulis endophyticus]|uniref:Plasmid maintenance system killer protein n=1 Tax=Asticcacaulis endophyticus TaxID=1395890 RepID=A0A918USM1_9CAUL|nr:plasmid maintenance system killer protein [Asticcacaulis endophyticus]